jgi:hypothetical protein
MKTYSCNPYAAIGLLAGFVLAAILPACAPARQLPAAQRAPVAQQSLTVLDARTNQPVAGALVFAPGDRRVFRSDLHGTVELPPDYVGREVRVHAKNHPPLSLAPGRARGTILLERDESRSNPLEQKLAFTRADSLRGTYGVYRANNDLLTYDLDIAVDVANRFISGTNTIRFRMLEEGRRIQLDLFENMDIDSIMSGTTRLSYEREHNAVFVDFPVTLRAGTVHEIAFHYSGNAGPPVGLHGEPGHRCEPVVAEQGPAARRSGQHDHPRRGARRPRCRLQRPVHGTRGDRRRPRPLQLERALPDQQLLRVAQHRTVHPFRGDAGRPDARLLRAAVPPRRRAAAVRAGGADAGLFPALLR